MLKGTLNTPSQLQLHGFLIAVEVEVGTDIEKIGNKIADGLTFMEGIGEVDVNHLGQLEFIEGEDEMGSLKVKES